MHFKDHILQGAPYQQALWMGGEITPTIVVLHDTASPLQPGNAAAYLADNQAKVSVHFVVERDGTITQQVPVNRRANHAGQSSFNGRSGCNGFSIGIEIVNPGRMTRAGAGKAKGWWGETFSIEDMGVEEITTAEHGHGLWMGYPQAQLAAVFGLLGALFAEVTTLSDITTHWYVSPGRKVDTNPLFPLEAMRAKILGRDDPADLMAEGSSIPENDPTAYVEIDAGGDTLNMRRWPSFNPNVLVAIPDGTAVPVLRRGVFDNRAWLKVRYAGQEGWVVARYTAAVCIA
ncbi:N-acetylmuramoyl-L-alanine amidase [Maritimibacter alkaliphilus]|uniref:N-acetylmuramoyl-L-alanine amidase n=1 Tax=Maritimibacter alkaliphilus TaxID=404236 RepID=UPI001C94BDC9|nr:N-acetylmuramoyl-L-alanine amidase [Maritimibacter alkaliphilus]MBY6091057.1 N-acetylmuramoyl-L-alanine amidase [Maritimibacter alkaliphilus]